MLRAIWREARETGEIRSIQCLAPGDLAHFTVGVNHGAHHPYCTGRVVTCTVDGVCHGGCHNAGEPCACPKLQHSAPLEEVPSEQDIVGQQQGAPPHLQERGQRTTGESGLRRDPQGAHEVDRAYLPACLHPPGVWPWCALDRIETKKETSMVKWRWTENRGTGNVAVC